MTQFKNTPILVLLLITFSTVVYTLFHGLEALGRSAEVSLPYVLASIIGIFLLVLISGKLNIKELTPVLAEGPKSLITTDLFKSINFPFGEIIVFLSYWKFVDQQDGFKKTSYLAIITSGLLITFTMITIIATLGTEYASIATIPFLEVIRAINVANIITNMDALGVILIFIGGFFKICIFFYAGVLTLHTILNFINQKVLIIILGIWVVIYSLTYFQSYSYHIWLGDTVHTPYMHYTFQFMLPGILLIASLLKSRYKNAMPKKRG